MLEGWLEEFKDSYIQATVQHGGGGIMVWRYINAGDVSFLSKVAGWLKGEGYINILENALVPTTHLLGIPRGLILQQDDATYHTCRLVKE